MRRFVVTTAMLAMLLLPQSAIATSPKALGVKYTAFRTPVQRGKAASVTVHTGPQLRCIIKVVYQGGVSHVAGLGAKYSNGSGNATWRWTVPASTTPGTWPVTVTCQSGGKSAKASRRMQITA